MPWSAALSSALDGRSVATTRGSRPAARAASAITGAVTEHWKGGAREADFFDAKGIVEALADALGVSLRFETATVPYLVAGQTAAVIAGETPLGVPSAACGREGLRAYYHAMGGALSCITRSTMPETGERTSMVLPCPGASICNKAALATSHS